MRTGRFHEDFPVTAFLLLINLAFFVLEVIQHVKYTRVMPAMAALGGIDFRVLDLLGALSWSRLEDGQYWRVVSCAFLHGGVIHMLFNGVMLVDLGRYCEPFLSSWKLLAAYGAGIAGSAAGSLVAGKLQGVETATVGASGALCALIGLLISYSIKQRQDDFRDALLHSVGWIVLYSLFFPGVDHGAHLGGFAAGAVFGLTVKDYVTSREAPRWRLPGQVVMALGLTAIAMALWNYFARR